MIFQQILEQPGFFTNITFTTLLVNWLANLREREIAIYYSFWVNYNKLATTYLLPSELAEIEIHTKQPSCEKWHGIKAKLKRVLKCGGQEMAAVMLMMHTAIIKIH